MNGTYLKVTLTKTHAHLIHHTSAHLEEVVGCNVMIHTVKYNVILAAEDVVSIFGLMMVYWTETCSHKLNIK
jgi:uncharacterized membrane protein